MQVSDNIADSCLYDLSGGLWGPSVQGEEVVKGLLVWAHFGVFRYECGSAEGCGGRVTLGGNGVGSGCRAADLYPFREGDLAT